MAAEDLQRLRRLEAPEDGRAVQRPGGQQPATGGAGHGRDGRVVRPEGPQELPGGHAAQLHMAVHHGQHQGEPRGAEGHGSDHGGATVEGPAEST